MRRFAIAGLTRSSPSVLSANRCGPGRTTRVRWAIASARSLGFVEAPGVEHGSGDVAGECRSE